MSYEATPQAVAISVRGVAKKFKLFTSKKDRVAEALHPFRKRLHQEFWALRDVSFDIYPGEIIGILGKNGSGKSTLLQIICGVMRASAGEVITAGRISALLELGAGFNPEFTGRQNVLLNGAIMGFSRHDMQDRLPAIEAFADVGEFFDQPVKTYSSGMFVRVAFAAAIHIDPEILVVDEALSVGDSKFQHRCFQRIRSFMEEGRTIVVVSHSADTLLRICHRGIVIDGGEVRFVGRIAEAVNFYQNLLFGAAVSPPALPDLSLAPGIEYLQGAMSLLDEDGHDIVATKANYNPHEVRLGNRAVSIYDFEIIANGVRNPPEIAARARTELIIKLRFDSDVPCVSVGFALVTVDGTYVFGTNLFMMERPLIDGQAGLQVAVRYCFTSTVAGGDYFLNLGCNQIMDGSDHYLDVRRSVARVKFAYTPGIVGFVNLDAEPDIVTMGPLLKAPAVSHSEQAG
jgi:lipopolysaccharide transport system ATP-binding protein